MTVYCWLQPDGAEKAVREGLEPEGEGLKGESFRETGGKYIAALLHPGDEEKRAGRVCVKLRIEPEKAYVAETGRIREKIGETLVKASGYRLGEYRKPVCLIAGRVPADNISIYDSSFDEPLLYESSEKLYVDRLFALADEADPGFRETALKAYFEKQRALGRLVRYSGEIYSGSGGAPKGLGRIVRTADEYRTPGGEIAGIIIEKNSV